jgi:hypothetical protein
MIRSRPLYDDTHEENSVSFSVRQETLYPVILPSWKTKTTFSKSHIHLHYLSGLWEDIKCHGKKRLLAYTTNVEQFSSYHKKKKPSITHSNMPYSSVRKEDVCS